MIVYSLAISNENHKPKFINIKSFMYKNWQKYTIGYDGNSKGKVKYKVMIRKCKHSTIGVSNMSTWIFVNLRLMPRTSVQRLLPCHILTLLKCLSRTKVFFYISSQQKVHTTKRTYIHLYSMGKHQNCWPTTSISVERWWRYKGFRKLRNVVIKNVNLKTA